MYEISANPVEILSAIFCLGLREKRKVYQEDTVQETVLNMQQSAPTFVLFIPCFIINGFGKTD